MRPSEGNLTKLEAGARKGSEVARLKVIRDLGDVADFGSDTRPVELVADYNAATRQTSTDTIDEIWARGDVEVERRAKSVGEDMTAGLVGAKFREELDGLHVCIDDVNGCA
ncbi:MAG: hypothetical protein P4L46_07500 [Fimbriimonas sp.]|nr:hypothetical protein [Fimbriimonas sp.]